MEVLIILGGIIFVSWVFSLFEGEPRKEIHHIPTNSKTQQEHHIWSTEINGTSVDPNSYWGRIRAAVFQRDHNVCTRCGSVSNLTVHHRRPLSLGGKNTFDNLFLLCSDCHEDIHKRHIFNKDFEGDDNYGRDYKVSRKIRVINDHMINSTPLKVSYTDMHGKHTNRSIVPKELIKEGSRIYLRAHCMLRNSERVFRISRLEIT